MESNAQSDILAEAKKRIVFLINCVNCRWKLPAGYFLINRLTEIQKGNLVKVYLTIQNKADVTLSLSMVLQVI